MFDNYKKRIMDKEKDHENVENLYSQMSSLEKKRDSMLELNKKIKIIKSSSQDDFSVQYSSFMKTFKKGKFFQLGGISDLNEEKIEYNGNEFILAIKYKILELKDCVDKNDYSSIQEEIRYYNNLYSEAYKKYYNKYGEYPKSSGW